MHDMMRDYDKEEEKKNDSIQPQRRVAPSHSHPQYYRRLIQTRRDKDNPRIRQILIQERQTTTTTSTTILLSLHLVVVCCV